MASLLLWIFFIFLLSVGQIYKNCVSTQQKLKKEIPASNIDIKYYNSWEVKFTKPPRHTARGETRWLVASDRVEFPLLSFLSSNRTLDFRAARAAIIAPIFDSPSDTFLFHPSVTTLNHTSYWRNLWVKLGSKLLKVYQHLETIKDYWLVAFSVVLRFLSANQIVPQGEARIMDYLYRAIHN